MPALSVGEEVLQVQVGHLERGALPPEPDVVPGQSAMPGDPGGEAPPGAVDEDPGAVRAADALAALVEPEHDLGPVVDLTGRHLRGVEPDVIGRVADPRAARVVLPGGVGLPDVAHLDGHRAFRRAHAYLAADERVRVRGPGLVQARGHDLEVVLEVVVEQAHRLAPEVVVPDVHPLDRDDVLVQAADLGLRVDVHRGVNRRVRATAESTGQHDGQRGARRYHLVLAELVPLEEPPCPIPCVSCRPVEPHPSHLRED